MKNLKLNHQKAIDTIQNNLFLRMPGAQRILNLGAADGNFYEKYPWYDYELVNVDNEHEGKEFLKCKKKYNEKDYPNIKNITTSCTDLSMLEDNYFDMVIFNHLIEHLTEKEIKKTLKEIKRVLKPNGFMTTSTPNRKLRKYFGKYKANEYHIEEFNYEEFKNYISSEFKIIKEYGAFNFDIETEQFKPFKIDDPENSYVMMFICKNEK